MRISTLVLAIAVVVMAMVLGDVARGGDCQGACQKQQAILAAPIYHPAIVAPVVAPIVQQVVTPAYHAQAVVVPQVQHVQTVVAPQRVRVVQQVQRQCAVRTPAVRQRFVQRVRSR